jgi:hypothetical protein
LLLVRLFLKEQTSVFSLRHIEARLTFIYTNSYFASRLPFLSLQPRFVISGENGITVHYHDYCGLISFSYYVHYKRIKFSAKQIRRGPIHEKKNSSRGRIRSKMDVSKYRTRMY